MIPTTPLNSRFKNLNMDMLSEIPDVLYKYRNWEDNYHQRILTNNELFLSSADLFNDPFDASLPFQYDKQELTKENIVKKLMEVGRNKWPRISEDELIRIANERHLAYDYSSDEHWRIVNAELKKKCQVYGICSLTSKKDNLLMWSHYANSHKGFCIGFDKYELFNTIQGVIGNVIYSDLFPKIPLFEKGFESSLRLIITKSKLWEYEDEYRISKLYGAGKIIKLNDLAYREIVFGCKIKAEHREQIISIAKSKASAIKLYDCEIDDKEFKLNLVEI